MCGLIGIAGAPAKDATDWVQRGADALKHRGPDDEGMALSADGLCLMAHRRLAIIDLSPAGHQPMQDVTGQVTLVFNGEIYNFRELRKELEGKGFAFRSNSDTEVLLNAYLAWSEECVERFNGMFAFAVYDQRQQKLLLARDRAGEKPLYFRATKDALVFASEIKAMLMDPSFQTRLAAESLDHYLAFGHSPFDRSMIEGVDKLPPAHYLVYDLRRARSRLRRYWQPPAPASIRTLNRAQLDQHLDEFADLFADSVRRQLVSDVPLGVLLSGGVDSSLVTAMAVHEAVDVHTFTLSLPDATEYDETPFARLIAHHFKTRHTELVVQEPEVGLLDKLARQFDDPIADASMIPTYLISQAIREHCTVAVGGDGGDELFGGYSRYNQQLVYQRMLGWMPGPVRRTLAAAADRVLPQHARGRGLVRTLGSPFRFGAMPATYRLSLAERNALIPGLRPSHPGEHLFARQMPDCAPGVQSLTRLDFATYLPEDLLVKVDRASMLASLEVRSPFLDYRIIEFAFGRLPMNLKTTPFKRKIFLKHLARRVLPDEFDLKRKQGFSVPYYRWFQSAPWRQYCEDALLVNGDSLFNRTQIDALLHAAHERPNVYTQLFPLVMLERWRAVYGLAL